MKCLIRLIHTRGLGLWMSEWQGGVAKLRPLMMGHLDRLEHWSFFSVIGGLAMPLLIQNRQVLMFGIVSAGWAAVNIAIALIGKKAPPPKSVAHFVRLLAANQVANYFYVLMGIGLGLFGESPDWRGSGFAVALQGFALMVLDGKLLKQTRELLEP
jgi:hypothetical protein